MMDSCMFRMASGHGALAKDQPRLEKMKSSDERQSDGELSAAPKAPRDVALGGCFDVAEDHCEWRLPHRSLKCPHDQGSEP